MKKLILSFLALIVTAPLVAIEKFSIAKESARNIALALQIYGSYRLLDQKNISFQSAAILAHVPYLMLTDYILHFIHCIKTAETEVVEDDNKFEFKVPHQGALVERFFSSLTKTLCFSLIVGLGKTN